MVAPTKINQPFQAVQITDAQVAALDRQQAVVLQLGEGAAHGFKFKA